MNEEAMTRVRFRRAKKKNTKKIIGKIFKQKIESFKSYPVYKVVNSYKCC